MGVWRDYSPPAPKLRYNRNMLRLYNTLTKTVEEFVPRESNLVTLYCCGPTVYDYAHIGNFRTYTMTDFLVRTLRHLGYHVKYVMNISDVGNVV